jgi:hypothetical protein
MRPMSNLKRWPKDSYTEREAAAMLGVTLARLHQLLDEHIFTDGGERPSSIEFTSSDLLLLSYWNSSTESPALEVIPMPHRK